MLDHDPLPWTPPWTPPMDPPHGPPIFFNFFFSFGPPEPPFLFFSSIILLCSSLYFHCFCSLFFQLSSVERELYNHRNNIKNSDPSWDPSKPIQEWRNVRLNSDGRLFALTGRRMGLQGTLSWEFLPSTLRLILLQTNCQLNATYR